MWDTKASVLWLSTNLIDVSETKNILNDLISVQAKIGAEQ